MRKDLGIAALAAILMTTLSACGVGEARVSDIVSQAAPAPLPVETTLPETTDIFATYEATTTILSDADAPVLARVGGEVVDIVVEEGDYVEQGQVLARLDGDRLRLQMQQAKAALDQSLGELKRLTSLHERGLVSAASFDGLKYDLEAQRAAYELKRLNYNYTSVRAAISGVVSSRAINVGQNVNIGDTTFHVTDTSKLVAYLRIPQTELTKFAPGHSVKIRVDAMADTVFEATIARISPTIDERNGTFRATAYIDNGNGELAPGMFGRFTIAYERHPDALVIPVRALMEEDGQFVVYVVEDGTALLRTVETGIRSGEKVEILSGLESNDVIVVTGQNALRDGTRVLASNVPPGKLSG
ncbi:MAG: efflux RND transporter periplasmic adaptor subunit [Gammaproteobacteria bacterium]|nr:efflux RND transporter periplasmic adaptor subunit [Gammaproteobacteria bacterium]